MKTASIIPHVVGKLDVWAEVVRVEQSLKLGHCKLFEGLNVVLFRKSIYLHVAHQHVLVMLMEIGVYDLMVRFLKAHDCMGD